MRWVETSYSGGLAWCNDSFIPRWTLCHNCYIISFWENNSFVMWLNLVRRKTNAVILTWKLIEQNRWLCRGYFLMQFYSFQGNKCGRENKLNAISKWLVFAETGLIIHSSTRVLYVCFRTDNLVLSLPLLSFVLANWTALCKSVQLVTQDISIIWTLTNMFCSLIMHIIIGKWTLTPSVKSHHNPFITFLGYVALRHIDG